MNAVVVVTHPRPDGFSHALASAAVQGLTDAGHQVTVLDLYGEGFRAAMTADERLAYHGDNPVLDPMVQRHVDAIRAAHTLVFVYPTWWSSLPAMLKGWLERVMVPGVGFQFDASGKVKPGLTNVRRLVGISTYGASFAQVKVLNDNGRRIINRAFRLSTGLRTRTTWLALYRTDHSTAEQRQAFLHKVRSEMARL